MQSQRRYPVPMLDVRSALVQAVREALDALGSAEVLVNCLGTNVARRQLAVMSLGDWDGVVATNLSAVFYCLHAVLPAMRERGAGLIVSISSVAALQPSVLSGSAYSAAKAGLNALSACINLEERENGIRSCVICPGDINTELLDRRPTPPTAEARARMVQPEDVAELVVALVHRPLRVLVDEIVVRPG